MFRPHDEQCEQRAADRKLQSDKKENEIWAKRLQAHVAGQR